MVSFSHLDKEGSARMVDVGEKAVIRRTAVASGRVKLSTGDGEPVTGEGSPEG